MWSIFILIFISSPAAMGLYSNQPRFRSDNGHLCIESATNHNISLITKGQGYINVNDENLLQVIGLARDAWGVVESFRSNDLPAFAETMKSVLPLIDGPRSLTSRVTALELQMSNGTASALQPANKGKVKTIPNADGLTNRLTALEKKITNLVNLLSVSECLSNPCQNGGTCVDLYNGFQCYCPHNWQGRLCELDVNECVWFARTGLGCQNGAECKNTPGSYECMCAPTWHGLHCTKMKNDCNQAQSAELCGNGVCINQLSKIGGYSCICDQGWTKDPENNQACTKDVDECKDNSHTCSSNPLVECRNTRGSFTCGNCPRGFEGDGFVCTDINECMTNNGGCSTNPRVQCINTRGSFKCESCPPGYIGDGINCVYASEGGACAVNNGGCHPSAECSVYGETTIRCTCRQGYKGAGVGSNGCIADSTTNDPCAADPCGLHGICEKLENNSFTCHCIEGYAGNTCNIRVINMCNPNPCQNGSCIRDFIESNDFYCFCDDGYTGRFCDIQLESCGGYIYYRNGTLRYPESNTTLMYQSNLNCLWTIEMNSIYVLSISFVWIDVEKTTSCSSDYVEIFNDEDDGGRSFGKFCGNTLPGNNIIVSDSNIVQVLFHTDTSSNFRGFELNYTMIHPICGGTINVNSHGTLTSPGFPGKYPAHRDCYWTLNAVPGKRLQFHFFSLQFERHANCSYDYIEISDGLTQHSPTLAKLCNSDIPPPISTSGLHAHLHFHSDALNQDYGFQLAYSVIEGVPGCSGIYTSPIGVISSPIDLAMNSYLNNLNCEWHIKMPLNQKIRLSFINEFDIQSSENCKADFLEIYDGPNIRSPLIGRYCGSEIIHHSIITNSNDVTLLFKSDFSSASKGFTIKYETLCGGTYTDSNGIIESPFYPNPYPVDKVCTYLIEQPIGKAIQLSFLDLDIEEFSYSICLYDSLEIRDGDNENSTKIALLCGTIEKLPELPYLSTHNYMWLKFSSDHTNNKRGFRANYSTVDIACGGILKEPSGIIQSSNNINDQYLPDQNCEWIIAANESTQIQITWLSFSLETQRFCNNDYVEIYDNSIKGNASKIARYCGNKVPPALTSIGNRLTIIFKTDHSIAQDGFMLSYIVRNKSQACGGNFFTAEGFLSSPNYPNKYPILMDCTWVISVPGTNQIELNIINFNLEYSFTCLPDFLQIRNGGYPTSPLIGQYCGSKILPTITSMGNSLYIRFHSDSSITQNGFFIQWYTTTKGCGGTLNTEFGHIISPNYPLPVQQTLECFYKITISKGSRIKLTIVDLELVTDNFLKTTCREDYLDFYDGGNTASNLLRTFCSNANFSKLVHSSSNQMYIRFRSSGNSKGRGFSLMYERDCNVTLKGRHGAIEFTELDNNKKEKCAWTIIAPNSSKINMTFTFLMFSKRFQTLLSRHKSMVLQQIHAQREYHTVELKDSRLNITEGIHTNAINTVLWKQTGFSDALPVIHSTKNIVRVTYNSIKTLISTDQLDRFRLEWIVDGCGGILNEENGEFTSPGYPGFYPVDTTCEWIITTDYQNTIEITIQDIWLEEYQGSCKFDFLAIYSGNDDSGIELLRICHKQESPITVTSGGNKAFVRFQSDIEYIRQGFRATYMTIPSKCGGRFTAHKGSFHTTNYPRNYESNISCLWFIEIAETHLVNLTFVDFNIQNNLFAGSRDKVLVYDGDNVDGKLLLNHSGNSIPPPVISSSNKLLVSFEVGKNELLAKGFMADYSTACGARITTNDSGIIASKSYYQLNKICSWTILSDTSQSKITLTFTHVDIVHFTDVLLWRSLNQTNQTDDVCSGSSTRTTIRILDGSDLDAPEITTFCKFDRLPPPIVSNGPAMRIEFIDDSYGSDSFTASYSVRSIACGGTYDTIKGTISSPNYPNNYLRDSECVWTIKASTGNRVSLNFIDFQLEDDEFCNEDYVEIRVKDSVGPVLGIFCGLNLPTNITTGSTLWIKFRSNSLGSARGFTADFKYVSENFFTELSGEISSPMYPRIYRDSYHYSWTIIVNHGKRVQILFKDCMIASISHILKIYDGSNTEALVLFDSKSLNFDEGYNKTIVSTDNFLCIQLRATAKDQAGIQFLLSWTEVDSNIELNSDISSYDHYLSPNTNTSVIITSPGYPYGYATEQNVTWTIHTEPHYHIEVEIIDVDLYFLHSISDTDFKDYVSIETVDPETAKTTLLRVVTKNPSNANDKIMVGKNKVIINFISQKSLNGTGFKVIARLKCGGQLRGPTGVIDVFNIKSSTFRAYSLCTWNVTVRPGRTMLVKFLTMQIFDLGKCANSYVLFKNGFYDDSSIVGQGKYCNITNNSPTLTTTENKLQIQTRLLPHEKVKIAFEEKSINCGKQIYLNNEYNITQITSPSYPNIPPAHIECIWSIVAPSDERIIVNIEDITLGSDNDDGCDKEYLEFREGATRFSPLISIFCGNQYLPDIETQENFLFMKFFTDLNVPSNGFNLSVSLAKCGGTLRNFKGTIKSPNYPGSYEANMDCEYRIVSNPGFKVALHFVMVNLNRQSHSINMSLNVSNSENYDDSLTVYDVEPLNNTRVMLTKIIGSNLPSQVIMSSSRELVIKFKSNINNASFFIKNVEAKFLIDYETVDNDCDKKYDVESGVITSHQFTSNNYKPIFCEYSIKVPKGRRVTVELLEGKSIARTCDATKSFLVQNAKSEVFAVYDSKTFSNVCVDPVIDPVSSNYIYESSMNEMILNHYYFHGDPVGFKVKFSSDKPEICGGVIDDNIKGQLEFPTKNVTRFLCDWYFPHINGTMVIIVNFKVNESKLDCHYDFLLKIFNNDERNYLKRYCPSSNVNDKFTILSPLLMSKIVLKFDSNTINFTGTVNYSINSCGGVMYGQQITITSPNYPKNYQQTTNCAWSLKLPEEKHVNIRFNGIDLESSCDKNYVIIHNGDSSESPVLGKYCGNIVPENIAGLSNKIWIEFSAENNGNNNKKGFNLTLESSSEVSCGLIYVSRNGQFFSKNYPSLYPNNDECEWTLSVLPGNRVSLKFVDRFSLEQSVNCTKDYVQVFDYVDEDWVQQGNRLCGREMPQSFNSSGTKLKVRLRTDGDIQGDGFKANWDSICGGIFTQNDGKIISPNYPRQYSNNLNCNYTISAPGNNIKIMFKSFELEDFKCRFDNLTIFNQAGDFANQSTYFVGSYCGITAPKTLTFKNSVMMIFKTDSSIGAKGFEIHYTIQRCGGRMNTSGIIKSPNNFYDEHDTYRDLDSTNCTWIIQAPPGQVVRLTFTKFRLNHDIRYYVDEQIKKQCPTNVVLVFDGSKVNSDDRQYLGVYCGLLDDRLPDIKSITNTMYVQLLSTFTTEEEGFVGQISFSYGESKGCGGIIRLNQTNSYTLRAPQLPTKTNLDCGWMILVEPSYQVQVQVVSYTETPKCPFNTTDCRCSSIQFLDGPGRMAQKIRQFCAGNVDNAPVLISSLDDTYILYRVFDTEIDVNFEIKITPVASICGRRLLTVTNQTQVLTFTNYSSTYGSNLMCYWTLQSKYYDIIRLNVTDLNLSDTKDCLSEYLEIHFYYYWQNFGTPPTVIRLCHKEHEFDFMIETLKPITLMMHNVDQKSLKGFRLEYKSLKCQPMYDKRNGRITLTSKIASSQLEKECTFTINTGQPNLTISVYFSHFNCMGLVNSSYLKVYDGPNVSAPLLSTLTNEYHLPLSLFSTGPTLTMTYKTSSNMNLEFDFIYTSTDQGRGCGGKIFNIAGSVTSPMYPQTYRKNSTCRWEIVVPRPYPIEIDLIVFNLGSRMTCLTDYLELYDVDQVTGKSSFVAKYCGKDNPAVHIGRTGAVSILYVTSEHNDGFGWMLTFKLLKNFMISG